MNGYFLLDFVRCIDLLLVVNEQSRFVLADGDWDELKKLKPIGTA